MEMNVNRALLLIGITMDAAWGDIEKAYKKMRIKLHPDKNKNENAHEQFLELQSAYRSLQFLKKDEIDKLNSNPKEKRLIQPQPNEYKLILTLEEIYHGCSKTLEIERKIENPINGKDEIEKKVLEVKVKPGIMTGSKILIKKEGDRLKDKIPADVVFIVHEERHREGFKRQKRNLIYTLGLTPDEAILGGIFWIPTLVKNVFAKLEITEMVTKYSKPKQIDGFGFPDQNKNEIKGKLIVNFDIYYDTDDQQDPVIESDLILTLEQILCGCKKIINIERSIVDSKKGEEKSERKMLLINVKPGSQDGDWFKFYRMGNKRPGFVAADIIFIVRVQLHPIFKRSGVDIEHTIVLSASDANNPNLFFEVPLLNENRKYWLSMNEQITKGTIKRISNHGLPFYDLPEKRGDLVVNFQIIEDSCIDPPVEYPLELTIENIMTGCTKEFDVTRKKYDNAGKESIENKILKIEIKPGTLSGTRYPFLRMADQYRNSIPGNIEFVAIDKAHETFKRNGANIEYIVTLTKYDLSVGGDICIPTLDQNVNLSLCLDNVAMEKRFKRYGLPYFDNPKRKGDLIVRLEIVEDPPQDPPVLRDLYLTIDKMKNGALKVLNFTIKVTDDKGNVTSIFKKFTTEIERKRKEGDKIIFCKAGDKSPGKIPADVIYVIKRKMKDLPIRHDLFISLEDILNGTTKQMDIARTIMKDDGTEDCEDKTILIEIKPGTRSGTEFVFPNLGNQTPGIIPADIIFIAQVRQNNEIENTLEIIE